MTTYQQGDIIVVPFPFTDLSQRKRPPALVISNDTVNATGDYLLAQVTSRKKNDGLSIEITVNDYASNPLPVVSYVGSGEKVFMVFSRYVHGERIAGCITHHPRWFCR